MHLNNLNILSYIIAGMIKARIREIYIVITNVKNKLKFKQMFSNSIENIGVNIKMCKIKKISQEIRIKMGYCELCYSQKFSIELNRTKTDKYYFNDCYNEYIEQITRKSNFFFPI